METILVYLIKASGDLEQAKKDLEQQKAALEKAKKK